MAFKKRDYKYWFTFFHQMIFKNGCSPYLMINEFQKDLIAEDNFEGAKAAKDVFDEWYSKYGMTEKETERYLSEFYKNHPVYGGKANFKILKH